MNITRYLSRYTKIFCCILDRHHVSIFRSYPRHLVKLPEDHFTSPLFGVFLKRTHLFRFLACFQHYVKSPIHACIIISFGMQDGSAICFTNMPIYFTSCSSDGLSPKKPRTSSNFWKRSCLILNEPLILTSYINLNTGPFIWYPRMSRACLDPDTSL